MTLEELNRKIQDYIDHGYYKDVVAAHKHATEETRAFIYRTHPTGGFDGIIFGDKSFKVYKKQFEIVGPGHVNSMVYANYFARWYNTGAFGRIIRGRGPRRGQRGPTYPARGDYFGNNKAAIEEYFRQQLEEYMQKHIKL